MLLGLIDADSGHIRIFDHEVPLALDQIIDRVGAIVEQPKFFPAFSGEKNLRLLARAIGAPQRRVAAVLDEVGLARRGSDKFRKYSLGMKQRLAIAATLLKNPDLLIFDEPTNGLDPAGIHEIRSMMRNLARRGKTVLVSSHILSEVQQIADTVTIIGRGRLLAEGNVSQILSADGQLSARVGVSDHSESRRGPHEVRLHRRTAGRPAAQGQSEQPAVGSCGHHAAAGRSGPVRLRAHTHPA